MSIRENPKKALSGADTNTGAMMMKLPSTRGLEQSLSRLDRATGHKTRRIAIDMAEAAEAQIRSQMTLYHGSRSLNRKGDLQTLVMNVIL